MVNVIIYNIIQKIAKYEKQMYYLENILCSFYRYYKEKLCKLKKCFKDNYGIRSRKCFLYL